MNTPSSPEELHTLMLRQLEGHATPDEARALSAALRDSADARREYVSLTRQHAQLFELAEERKVVVLDRPAVFTPPRAGWFSGLRARMAASLVAGLILGALTVGVVLAHTMPRTAPPREIPCPLVSGGFEPDTRLMRGGPPATVGNWQGDVCEITGATGAVTPQEGTGMLRFISVNPTGNEADTKPICSDLWQVLTLESGRQRTLKVRAWFNADTGTKQARYHLYAMAGAGDAATAPALWSARFGESSDILASGRTMKFVDSDPATWEAAEVTLNVPAEARLLVIAIAAYRLPNVRQPTQWLPAQFADDVSVSVVEAEAAK